MHVRNRTLRLPQNDPNSTKIIFCKTETKNTKLPQLILFNNTLFRDQVLNKLINSKLKISNKDLKHFKETCLSVVNTIAPLKSRFIRANQAPFINKEIQRGVMVRSKLRKKFLKSRSKSGKKHTINIENISLIENGNLLNDDFEIVQTFNKYFQNLIPLI